MIFTGAYERSIDEKKRIQIPAPFRNVVDPDRNGGTFYIVPGERENTLALYPEKYFNDKVASLRTDQIPGQEALDFEQMFFSLASRVEMDKQGRVVLPDRQLSMVDLGAEVYVTGAHYRLDLWRKSDYERFLQEVVSRKSVLQNFLRMGGRAPEAGSE
jgi:MraZ protein